MRYTMPSLLAALAAIALPTAAAPPALAPEYLLARNDESGQRRTEPVQPGQTQPDGMTHPGPAQPDAAPSSSTSPEPVQPGETQPGTTGPDMMDESDRDYAPGERPGGYGEDAPVSDEGTSIEEMNRESPAHDDAHQGRDEPKGKIRPREERESEEKPWYRFWE